MERKLLYWRKRKVKIMIVSDGFNLASGYAKVAKNLLLKMKERGHEVANVHLQYSGSPVVIDGIHVYPGVLVNHIRLSVLHFKPDVVVHLRDSWVLCPTYFRNAYDVVDMLKDQPCKVVYYTPLNAMPYPKQFIDQTCKAHLIIVPTQWCKDIMVECGAPESKIVVVPHGVDLNIYKPMKVDKSKYGMRDVFTFGFVAANTIRKDFGTLIRAFLRVRKKYDCQLYIHTGLPPTGDGYNLQDLIAGSKLLEKATTIDTSTCIWIPTYLDQTWGTSEETLAELYNCFDIFTHISRGEGFGIPSLEALACGVPVLYTNYSSLPEVVGDAGIPIKVAGLIGTVYGGYEALTDVDDLTEKMITIIEDDHLRKELSRKALRRAKQYTWDQAANIFEDTLLTLVEG